ncbi:hypothetical protein [Mannheimia haemolytica]|uniref:hypothetical protein n=1 Tax=Mannheimia haemolytica TaxID=75985 RepID=UPI0038F60272
MKALYCIMMSALLITGCTTSTEELLPANGSTMRDIWDKGAGNNDLHLYRSQQGTNTRSCRLYVEDQT